MLLDFGFQCTAHNFSVRKAIQEIQDDLKSKAIWYNNGSDFKNMKHGMNDAAVQDECH